MMICGKAALYCYILFQENYLFLNKKMATLPASCSLNLLVKYTEAIIALSIE